MKQSNNRKEQDIFCSKCKKKINGIPSRKRTNYYHGKKSKPRITRICLECKDPIAFKEWKRQNAPRKMTFHIKFNKRKKGGYNGS